MDSNIETLLKASIALAEDKFKQDNIVRQFEKSNENFKELVKKGLVKERGHNLLSISDSQSISRTVFNAY
jgi:hypothetical protein